MTAHTYPDDPRRRYFALCDQRHAASMTPTGRWLYLHRHAIGFVLRWIVLAGLVCVTAWAWVPIIAIPLLTLAKASGLWISHTP